MSTGSDNHGFGRMAQNGLQRGLLYGVIIVTALIAFEAFNYSSTQYALSDLLGNLSFLGFRWATILAIAFCGIDFAGIARLFTPEQGANETNEVWYLFGAWLLAATMNALLTWWGISIALINHQTQSSAVISPDIVLKAVPIVVAVIVWLIRILIIGTFSLAGDRLFSMNTQGSGNSYPLPTQRAAYPRRNSDSIIPSQAPSPSFSPPLQQPYQPSHRPVSRVHAAPAAPPMEPTSPPVDSPPPSRPEPVYIPENGGHGRSDPTYHSLNRPNRPDSRGQNR